MVKKKEKRALIYSLSHPITKDVRYVGRTFRTLSNRLSSHLGKARRMEESTHKANWIRKLLREDLKPKIELLEKAPFGKHVEREKWWIKYFRRENLTNSTDGGDGNLGWHPTLETRKKMSEGKMGNTNAVGREHSHSLDTKHQISESLTGKKHRLTSSIHVGVSQTKSKKWRSYIKLDGASKHLGTFENEIIAAQNYDLASMRYHKGKYPINFPNLKRKYKKLIKQGTTKITDELK